MMNYKSTCNEEGIEVMYIPRDSHDLDFANMTAYDR